MESAGPFADRIVQYPMRINVLSKFTGPNRHMTCTPSPEKKSEAEKADSENSQKLSRKRHAAFPAFASGEL
jgi:hypothetical protein